MERSQSPQQAVVLAMVRGNGVTLYVSQIEYNGLSAWVVQGGASNKCIAGRQLSASVADVVMWVMMIVVMMIVVMMPVSTLCKIQFRESILSRFVLSLLLLLVGFCVAGSTPKSAGVGRQIPGVAVCSLGPLAVRYVPLGTYLRCP